MIPVFDDSTIMMIGLLLVRTTAFVMMMPILSQKIVPKQAKAGLVVMICFLMWPSANTNTIILDVNFISYTILVLKEIIIAAAIGLCAQMIFATIQMAGQIISYQMGLAVANVFDPATSTQVSVIGQFINTIGILIWLSVGAHHIFIGGLVSSYDIAPIGANWQIGGLDSILSLASNIFYIGLKIAAPIVILVVLINVSLGLISRAVPQIQVFFVSFPLTIGLGLFALMTSLPAIATLISDQYKALATEVPKIIMILGGMNVGRTG